MILRSMPLKFSQGLNRHGEPIGTEDPMIASTAIANGLIVVPANTERLSHIPWFAAGKLAAA